MDLCDDCPSLVPPPFIIFLSPALSSVYDTAFQQLSRIFLSLTESLSLAVAAKQEKHVDIFVAQP